MTLNDHVLLIWEKLNEWNAQLVTRFRYQYEQHTYATLSFSLQSKFGFFFKEITSIKERFFCFMVMQTAEA